MMKSNFYPLRNTKEQHGWFGKLQTDQIVCRQNLKIDSIKSVSYFRSKSTRPPTHYTHRSGSAMETQAMKLPVHSFRADALQLHNLTLHGWAAVFPKHFHFQLILEYLEGKKFHELTCCCGGVLLQHHPEIHGAHLNHSFTNVCKGSLHGSVIDFIHQWDWKHLKWRLGGVAQILLTM